MMVSKAFQKKNTICNFTTAYNFGFAVTNEQLALMSWFADFNKMQTIVNDATVKCKENITRNYICFDHDSVRQVEPIGEQTF